MPESGDSKWTHLAPFDCAQDKLVFHLPPGSQRPQRLALFFKITPFRISSFVLRVSGPELAIGFVFSNGTADMRIFDMVFDGLCEFM